MRVVQSMWSWLPVTMQWMYRQLASLPSVEYAVLTDSCENIGFFPAERLLPVTTKSQRLFIKILTRLGARYLPVAQSRALRRYNPDLVHSHFGDRGWKDQKWVRKAGLPHIVSFYGLDVDFIPEARASWRRRYKELFSEAACVLCLGPVMRRRLVARGCPENKLRIHHVGTNVEEIIFCPRVRDMNRPLRVLVAASFREKKGIPLAIRAIAAARRNVDIVLTIVGDADNDRRSASEKIKILETIERENVTEITKLMGFLSHTELMKLSYEHDVLLAPSITAKDGDQEGTPVALMDMMATGMPVITTRHSDIPEVVEGDISGLVAEEGDVQGLANYLVMIAENPDIWHSMVTNARARIEREFNNKVQGQRLSKIYSDLL